MARTDKDTPRWVLSLNSNRIDHRHERGDCILETDHHLHPGHHSRWGRHRAAACAKYTRVPATCENDRWRCDNRAPLGVWPRLIGECTGTPHAGRTLQRYSGDLACLCDTWVTPTCFRVPADEDVRGYYWGRGPDRDYRRDTWHGPERARTRENLNDARRAYNAGEDLEGYDHPNFQHRHRAAWHWF